MWAGSLPLSLFQEQSKQPWDFFHALGLWKTLDVCTNVKVRTSVMGEAKLFTYPIKVDLDYKWCVMHINRRRTILLWSFRLGFILTTGFIGCDRVTPNIFGIQLCTNRRKLWLRINKWVSGQLGPRSLELSAASVWLEQSEVCLPRDKGYCLWLTFLSHQSDALATFHPSALLHFLVGSELCIGRDWCC